MTDLAGKSDVFRAFHEGVSGRPRGAAEYNIVTAMASRPGPNVLALSSYYFAPGVADAGDAYRIGRAVRGLASFFDQGDLRPAAFEKVTQALRAAALADQALSFEQSIALLTIVSVPLLRAAGMDTARMASELAAYANKPVKSLAEL